jgi:transcription termination factor Rho
MGTIDPNNESPQPAASPHPEVELTNDSLLSPDNGEGELSASPPADKAETGTPVHRPKRTIKRRKIRVELIKDAGPERREEKTEAAHGPEDTAAAAPAPEATTRAPTAGVRSPFDGQGAVAAPPAVEATQRPPAMTQNENRLHINDLTQMSMPDLRGQASRMGISHEALISMKKQEIIFQILKAHTERGGVIYAFGALEILPDGYGFLRSPNYSYLPGPDDIYISPSQIRLFNLKT